MGSFLDAAVAFPTAIFTTLLGVASFYWLLALVGLVDFDTNGQGAHVDIHTDAHAHVDTDVDGHDWSTLAGVVVAFGLQGVPLSIVASLLVLFSWMLSCLGAMWLLPLLASAVSGYVAGTVLALASVSMAVWLAGRIVRPLRRFFVTHTAISNASLVGRTCKVLTQSVDERSGRAEITQRGANINIRVWAHTPNPLARGATARVLAYEEKNARYLIEADS